MSSDKLSTSLIGKYQDAFTRFSGKDGSVTSNKVSSILKTLGQNPSEAEVQVRIEKKNSLVDFLLFHQDLVTRVDKDGTGSIDLPEFLQMMRIKFEEEIAEEEIRNAFQVFDGVSRC